MFIDNPYDVTITPVGSAQQGFESILLSAQPRTSGMTFEQARNANLIYQGNGLICQRQMCRSITGCDNPNGCPNNPNWNKIVEFCGPNNTPAMSMDGSWWQLEPTDLRQQMLTATERSTGWSVLPDPYNVVGMY